jgi:dTDP-glucose 4,6-dehydratase
VPVIITRASNNYGPYQFPEKLIPLFATNAIDGIPVPVYGDGRHVRDWLHVLDHCRAIDVLLEKGADGEVYNVGGGNEVANIDLTNQILDGLGKSRSLIRPVPDRLGHDRRYCLDTTRLRSVGWSPQVAFADGLRDTLEWYRANEWWWRPIKEGDGRFKSYYRKQYETRQ